MLPRSSLMGGKGGDKGGKGGGMGKGGKAPGKGPEPDEDQGVEKEANGYKWSQ